METKDTELTETQINKLAPGIKRLPGHEYAERIVLCNTIKQRQAEISFKAGMKVVSDWIQNNRRSIYESEVHVGRVPGLGFSSDKIWYLVGRDEWQTFLKEKGIE